MTLIEVYSQELQQLKRNMFSTISSLKFMRYKVTNHRAYSNSIRLMNREDGTERKRKATLPDQNFYHVHYQFQLIQLHHPKTDNDTMCVKNYQELAFAVVWRFLPRVGYFVLVVFLLFFFFLFFFLVSASAVVAHQPRAICRLLASSDGVWVGELSASFSAAVVRFAALLTCCAHHCSPARFGFSFLLHPRCCTFWIGVAAGNHSYPNHSAQPLIQLNILQRANTH